MKEYKCERCNYQTTNVTVFNNHLKCKKHIERLKNINNLFHCVCSSSFMSLNGLNKHKRKCIKNKEYVATKVKEIETLKENKLEQNEMVLNNIDNCYLYIDLIKDIEYNDDEIKDNPLYQLLKFQCQYMTKNNENMEKELNLIKQEIKELKHMNKQLLYAITKNPTFIEALNTQNIFNNTTNNHNLTLNIDIDIDKFIVNNYKDAMNITDVINDIQFGEQQLKQMIHDKLYPTIKNYFLEYIEKMEQSVRPLHYFKGKNKDFYVMIKHKDVWNKLCFDSKEDVNEMLKPDFHKQNIKNNKRYKVSEFFKKQDQVQEEKNEVVNEEELEHIKLEIVDFDESKYQDGLFVYVKKEAIDKLKEYLLDIIVNKINKSNVEINKYYKQKYNVDESEAEEEDDDDENKETCKVNENYKLFMKEINKGKYDEHYYEVLEVIKILGEYNSYETKPNIIKRVLNEGLIMIKFI